MKKKTVFLGALTVAFWVLLFILAFAQPDTADTSKQLNGTNGNDKTRIILVYVWIIALVAAFPTVVDIIFAYTSRNRFLGKIIDKYSSSEASKLQELKELIKESGKAPPGISGLTRGLMALTVIVILGIAVFHILIMGVSGSGCDNCQIVNNVLSMLAGLLSAIAGFYFGGKAAEKKMEETPPPAAPTVPPTQSGFPPGSGGGP